MNGVLLETPFWDDLQQKEFRSAYEFYRKARKYLKLDDSKEALHKIERMTTGKKNDLEMGVDGQKVQDKRRGEERINELEAQRNRIMGHWEIKGHSQSIPTSIPLRSRWTTSML